jgi:hypothetical protein
LGEKYTEIVIQNSLKNKTPILLRGHLKKTVQRWWKCIEVRGDFVEK